MKRRDWITGFPFLALVPGCSGVESQYWDFEVNFSGKVAVVGAGAAGLAAGYLLDRYDVEFEVLEASSVIGGRVMRSDDFADFPIDLGAEWIHQDPRVLAALIDNPAVEGTIDVVPYSPETIAAFSGGKLRHYDFGANYYSEYKFRRTTWYGFLEQHIAPGILDRIRLDTPVVEIDASGDGVALLDANGDAHQADRVLVTAPIKILQGDSLRFVPALSADRISAIESIKVPDGFKAFLEFDERFYPDLMVLESPLSATAFDRIYYDAAFRKGSSRNILGLFCVGDVATQYTSLPDDDAIRDRILADLDEIFDGRASAAYVSHVVQNWSRAPYIQGAYSVEFPAGQAATIETLTRPHEDKVYFAGEALSLDNGSTVPGAMESAYAIVQTMLASG